MIRYSLKVLVSQGRLALCRPGPLAQLAALESDGVRWTIGFRGRIRMRAPIPCG